MTQPVTVSTADLAAGIKCMDEAYPAYDHAHSYYRGAIDEFFDNIKLRRKLRNAARAYNINFASIPVDAVAERLKIASLTTEHPDASAALLTHWDENLLGLFAQKAMHGACEFGDYYVITWPRELDDQGRALQLDTWINDPRECRIVYDEERPLIKKYLIKRWVSAGVTRVDLYYPERIEKLVSKTGTEGNNAADFVPYLDNEGDAWPYPNPTGEIPGFHLRNDAPYGRPEHAKFYGIQNVLIKLITSHMGSVDYNWLKQRYRIAETSVGQADAGAIDPDLFVVDDSSVDPDDDDQAALDSRPGGLWDLKGTKSVGEFSAAVPEVFTNPMGWYLRMGAQITATPVHKIDPTGQVESGESRRAADAPLTNKVGNRQDWMEATWSEWARFVLRLLGYDDVTVTVRWEPAETIDDLNAWQTALVKIQAGVPTQQVLIEMGYDPDQVAVWFADIDPETDRGADLLLKVGQALTALGTAASMLPDVVNGELVQSIIDVVLGEEEVPADGA